MKMSGFILSCFLRLLQRPFPVANGRFYFKWCGESLKTCVLRYRQRGEF